MKLLVFFLMAIFLNSCCDCDKSKEKPKPVVTGKLTWQEWQNIAQWKSYNAKNYKPNETLVNQLKTLLSTQQNITFIMISASWCPDSETEVPKYFKLMELCEVDDSKISLYGVDREKKEATGTSQKYKIEKVPTLIILKDMLEIGRIVEFPVLSWEDDILTILEATN